MCDRFKLSLAVSKPIWFLSVCRKKHFFKKYLLKEATSKEIAGFLKTIATTRDKEKGGTGRSA
jgi:hypothetical protein